MFPNLRIDISGPLHLGHTPGLKFNKKALSNLSVDLGIHTGLMAEAEADVHKKHSSDSGLRRFSNLMIMVDDPKGAFDILQ